MRYIEYALTDLGYHVAALDGPGEIWGLDNRVEDGDDQRFWHLGIVPVLTAAVVCYEKPGTAKTKALAVFADGVTPPEGGTEILADDVVALLESDYDWPAGSRLVSGIPMGPEPAEAL